MRPRSLAVLTALALASAPFLAGAASSADTVVGDSTAPTSGCAGDQTLLQSTSAGSAYSVPTAGVITSWRTTGGPATVNAALKVGRVGLSNGFPTVDITGSSALAAVPAGQPVSTPTRVPVKAGDLLGLYLGTANSVYCSRFTNDTADSYLSVNGNVQPGGSARVDTPSGQRFRIPVAATVEPDADGDGFGDTTQDSCPTQAGTQGACKDLVAPNTSITSAKAGKAKPKITRSGKKKFKKAEVTVTFASTEAGTFGCSIDGAASTPCRSPLTVKLKKGTHTIAVRATDAAGNVDATPATTTVTVKKAKTKKKR